MTGTKHGIFLDFFSNIGIKGLLLGDFFFLSSLGLDFGGKQKTPVTRSLSSRLNCLYRELKGDDDIKGI